MYSLKTLILRTFKISSQIKHELTTLLTTAEAGYKTSIDRSDMCWCSFAEENRQNVGCTSSSRGLNVDEFLIRFIKCVVPENIHTPTTEGIGNSGGVGGQKPRKIQRRGGLNG